MGKTAVITGITGQDGSYLAELLLSKGYEVWGVQRRSSVANLERVEHLVEKEGFNICEGDVTDYASMSRIIGDLQPDEVYNLAAQSHVRVSFNEPFHTTQVNYIGCLNLLEAIRHNSKHSKFYQASTSEMFGKNYTVLDDGRKVQNEDTLFMPQSPYAVAKLAAHHACEVYRDSYDIFACSGILFNHESERRGLHFVTRKITSWIGEFYNWWDREPVLLKECDSVRKSTSEDKFPKLRLGNLDSMRDWGHSEDYVRAMFLMLQQESPNDFVIATGHTYSIRDFLKCAFECIGIYKWDNYVVIDPKFYRPADVEYLCGDYSKAKSLLGWEPEINFSNLVKTMVEHDVHSHQRYERETGSRMVVS